jgi:hypothetical protein
MVSRSPQIAQPGSWVSRSCRWVSRSCRRYCRGAPALVGVQFRVPALVGVQFRVSSSGCPAPGVQLPVSSSRRVARRAASANVTGWTDVQIRLQIRLQFRQVMGVQSAAWVSRAPSRAPQIAAGGPSAPPDPHQRSQAASDCCHTLLLLGFGVFRRFRLAEAKARTCGPSCLGAFNVTLALHSSS